MGDVKDGEEKFYEVKASGFDRGSFSEIIIDGVPYPAQAVAKLVTLSADALLSHGETKP